MGDLTRNFSTWEFEASQIAARKGWDNKIPEELTPNVRMLADKGQQIRNCLNREFGCDLGGAEISVNLSSGFRGSRLNRYLGSKPTSAHRQALGMDFGASRMSPREVFNAIRNSRELMRGVDQIILEHEEWCHLGMRLKNPRGEVLIASLEKRFIGKPKTVYQRVGHGPIF